MIPGPLVQEVQQVFGWRLVEPGDASLCGREFCGARVGRWTHTNW
jgi:hypothetical protein